MAVFHTPEYVDFLRRVSPDNFKQFSTELQKCAWLHPRLRAPMRLTAEAAGWHCSQLGRVH